MNRLRTLRLSALVVVVAVSSLTWPLAAHAAIGSTPTRTWGIGPATATSASATKPRVLAILPIGDRIYVGGSFDSVIDPTGVSYPTKNLAVFSASTGVADLSFAATTNNAVTSLTTDGTSLFVGGTFGTVNGTTRRGLAALNPGTGALTSWNPAVGTTGQVDTLAYAGGAVYAGGNFLTVTGGAGSSQAYVAKIDAASATVDSGWHPTPDDRVRSLNVAADGTGRIFLAGDFTSVSARASTNKLAAVSMADPGDVDPAFRAGPTNLTAFAQIFDVTSDGTRVYAAAGGSGGACTALDAATGAVLWSDHSNGNLQSVRLSGGLLYCAGHFGGTTSFMGQSRQKLASVNAATGALTAFAPKINSALGAWALASDATHIYLGGDFSTVTGVAQPHYAMFTDTAAATAPSPPTGALAQPGNSVVHLSWSASSSDGGSPLTKYKIYRSTTPGGEALSKPPLAALSRTSFGYDDTAVTNGTRYYYVIVATNAVGSSAPSNEASATPSGSATVVPPGAPLSVSATDPAGHNHLQWNPPSSTGGAPVTSYRVYRGTAPGAEGSAAVGTASTTSFDDVYGLSAGTKYYYVVTALNQAGEGTPSAEVSTVATAGSPGPAQLTATTVSGPAVQLGWTMPSDGGSPITKYVVLRDSVRLVTLTATGAGPLTYADTAVASGTTYTYQVRAVNAIGSGQLSNKAIITIP
ncbi:MAG: fibronectin type III domain-containing protein [Actinomycetota bacterium]